MGIGVFGCIKESYLQTHLHFSLWRNFIRRHLLLRMEKNTRKQIKHFQKLRAKAQEKKNVREEAESINFLGQLHSEIGEYDEALDLHKSELKLCQILEDKIGQAVANRKIGECYANLGNFTRALHHQSKHLELAKMAESLPEQQRAFATIGRTYFMQGEDLHEDGNFDDAKSIFFKAEDAYKSSIRFSQSIKKTKCLPEKEIHLMETRAISNLAYVYHFISLEENEDITGHYSKQCLTFYRKALIISQNRILPDETHRVRMQLAMYFRYWNKISEASQHAEEAVRSAKVAQNVKYHLEALGDLGEIQLHSGNCESARKSFKKCFRLSQDSENKAVYREKLKTAVKILSLQRQCESSSSMDLFKLYEKIADKFCEAGYYQAAIDYYQKQEKMFPELQNLSPNEKASVYYSLALTCSDLNRHQTAVEYYHKEMEFYSNPKELSKTWTQIGKATEKISPRSREAEACYEKAAEYAERSGDAGLHLKALSLLLDVQEKLKSADASETRERFTALQHSAGILCVDDIDSEDVGVEHSAQETQDCESDDCDSLVDKELTTISDDDSDSEKSRKSRDTSAVWKNKLNEKGESPLHRACIDGHEKRVRILLEQKHPINIPDYAGWTPLHEACNHGFTEIVRTLLENDADVNFKANCGTTPAQDAAGNGHFDIVDLLLDNKASVSTKNQKGDTALSNLEYYYTTQKEDLDVYDEERYQKLHDRLKLLTAENVGLETEAEPTFLSSLNGVGDVFDPEICTQDSKTSTQISQSIPNSYATKKRARPGFEDDFSSENQENDPFSGPDFEDWLVDDGVEELRPSKRSKTGVLRRNSSATQQVVSKITDKNSGSFSMSLINHFGVRERRASSDTNPAKLGHIPLELGEKIVIDDEEVQCQDIDDSPVRKKKIVSSVKKSPLPMESIRKSADDASRNSLFRVRVKIEGKMFLIPVPVKTKTIGWLCDRSAAVYKQNTGLHPNLTLYTSGVEEEACLLSKDDVIFETLQSNEQVNAKVTSWNTVSLTRQYEETCSTAKQAVHPVIRAACQESETTEKIVLRNKGVSSKQLNLLVKSMTQRIKTISLAGNRLSDTGLTRLCDTMQIWNTPANPGCHLAELNLRCTGLSAAGLKHLARTAESGVLKNLLTLDLSCNHFDDSCSEEVSTVLRECGSVRSLFLSRCGLSREFFRKNQPALKASLQGCTSLSDVDFSHNALGPLGCEMLLRILPYESLTKLNLTGICEAANPLCTSDLTRYLRKDGCALQTLHCGKNHLDPSQIMSFVSELKSIPKMPLVDLDVSKHYHDTFKFSLADFQKT